MRLKGTTLTVFGLMMIWGANCCLGLEEKPEKRIRDEHKMLSPDMSLLLEDYLNTAAKSIQFESYLVILKNESFEESVRLSDEWQRAWVPRGDGGVFVFSSKDGKLCFTPTEETMALVGQSNLVEVFRQMAEFAPPTTDLGVALPTYRTVSAVEAARLKNDAAWARDSKAQAERWKIVAGIAGAVAVAAVLCCGFLLAALLSRGRSPRVGGVPAPGMAYRNPPRRSRSGRKRRSSSGEKDRY